MKPGEPVGWYKVHAAKTEKTLESREKTRRMTKGERDRRRRSEGREREDTESSDGSDERERKRKSKSKPAAGGDRGQERGEGGRWPRIRKVATPGSRPVGEQSSRESSSGSSRTAGRGRPSDEPARAEKRSLAESTEEESTDKEDEAEGSTGGGGEVEVCLDHTSVDEALERAVQLSVGRAGRRGSRSGPSGSRSGSSGAGGKTLQHGRLKGALRQRRKLGPTVAPTLLASVAEEEEKGRSGYEQSSDDEAFTSARKSNQRDRYEKRATLSVVASHPCTLEGNRNVHEDYLGWSEKSAGFTTPKTGQTYGVTLFKRSDGRSFLDYMTERVGPDFRLAHMVDFHDRERHVSAVDAAEWIDWAAPGTHPTDAPFQ